MTSAITFLKGIIWKWGSALIKMGLYADVMQVYVMLFTALHAPTKAYIKDLGERGSHRAKWAWLVNSLYVYLKPLQNIVILGYVG